MSAQIVRVRNTTMPVRACGSRCVYRFNVSIDTRWFPITCWRRPDTVSKSFAGSELSVCRVKTDFTARQTRARSTAEAARTRTRGPRSLWPLDGRAWNLKPWAINDDESVVTTMSLRRQYRPSGRTVTQKPSSAVGSSRPVRKTAGPPGEERVRCDDRPSVSRVVASGRSVLVCFGWDVIIENHYDPLASGRDDTVLMTAAAGIRTYSRGRRDAGTGGHKVNRIVSRYEYHHFFMVMVFLFVIQDQRFPNHVIIIRFVRYCTGGAKRATGKKGKRIVNEGIILLGSAGSHFSLKLYSAFDVNIKMYIILTYTPSQVHNTQEIMSASRWPSFKMS